MKVYRWEQTDSAYIAVIRPDDLFDLSTKIEACRKNHEAEILAKHVLYGEMLTYALVFDKGCVLELIESMLSRASDVYLQRDNEALDILENSRRKTA